eukprot:m.21432 g.21432  ORF g.21432 m.21432 type:complete len:93 (-) comp9108_c1_seq1:20-298(-)
MYTYYHPIIQSYNPTRLCSHTEPYNPPTIPASTPTTAQPFNRYNPTSVHGSTAQPCTHFHWELQNKSKLFVLELYTNQRQLDGFLLASLPSL